MLFLTSQMSRLHGLDAVSLDLSVNGKQIERVSTFPLLGTQVHQNLKWNNDCLTPGVLIYTLHEVLQ